jgi:NO-binding membrane sensor protein with MHYT domain
VVHHDQLWDNSAYPLVAYLIAFIGAALGLACTTRLRVVGAAKGKGWLFAGALSLGTGIWGMHFVAMLGYSVQGVTLHYSLLPTVMSWVIAVVFVGVGMLLAGRDSSLRSLAGAGLLSGLGIAGMHYLGMAAIIIPGSLHYNAAVVILSVVIAIVAATAALWATLRVTGPVFTAAAALVMGAAIGGMHYTGMMAVTSTATGNANNLGGVAASTFVVPLIAGLTLIIFIVGFTVMLNPVADLKHDLSAASASARTATPAAQPHGADR